MTEEEPEQNPKLPEDARLTSLDERLKRARLDEAFRTGAIRREPGKGQSQGMRILSVLFGYPLGSALIGWVIDQWLGTRWVLVAMLFLGFVIAFREVWKISKERPE